jgi:hypothetical protein
LERATAVLPVAFARDDPPFPGSLPEFQELFSRRSRLRRLPVGRRALTVAGAAKLANPSGSRRKTMPRIAHCCCGSLRVETTGEPAMVVACHCRECQRRTGAPFSVSVIFEKAQVRAEGASTIYIRDGQQGRKIRFHFCPECGTTVYWDPDRLPDHIIVAFGAFADPAFPAPTRSIWEESRHSWVEFGHDLEFRQQHGTTNAPSGWRLKD